MTEKKKQIEQSFLGAENLFWSNSEMPKLSENDKRSLEQMVELIEYHLTIFEEFLRKRQLDSIKSTILWVPWTW